MRTYRDKKNIKKMKDIFNELKGSTIRVMKQLNPADPLHLIKKLDSEQRDKVIFEFTK
jgi:hypothetical protein